MKTLLDCFNIFLIFKATAELNRTSFNQHRTCVQDICWGNIFSLKTILIIQYVQLHNI